jgi:hypothetical protein
MAHPVLRKLDLTYSSGSAWTPGDFNRISAQSGAFLDFLCGPHDTDLGHTNDELIPKEAVIATYSAPNYTAAQATSGISALVRNSAGNITIQFDPDFPTGFTPMLVVFPVVQSTEQVFAYQEGSGTNDNTAVTFAMFDTTIPAFADRDFIALIFGPRR